MTCYLCNFSLPRQIRTSLLIFLNYLQVPTTTALPSPFHLLHLCEDRQLSWAGTSEASWLVQPAQEVPGRLSAGPLPSLCEFCVLFHLHDSSFLFDNQVTLWVLRASSPSCTKSSSSAIKLLVSYLKNLDKLKKNYLSSHFFTIRRITMQSHESSKNEDLGMKTFDLRPSRPDSN